VVGNHTVRGVKPGETGTTDDAGWVAWAVRAGHVEVVKPRPVKKTRGD